MSSPLTRSTVPDVPEVRPWEYPYAQIADHYREEIRVGRLKPGDRVDSITEIAKAWNVALATAQRALGQLKKERLVVAQHGRGFFVADKSPP
jgi:GntR family transcriptional regulator